MSLRLAELQQDADDTAVNIDKVILAAMAPGGGTWTNGGATDPGQFTTADQYLSDGSVISTNNVTLIDNSSTEFFMIAAANDRPPNNEYNDLVDLMTTANQRMSDRTDSEGNSSPVSSTLKIYESWMPPESGHNLFMKVVDGGQDLVNEPGYYWYDIIRFLKSQPVDTTHRVLVPEPDGCALVFFSMAALAFCRENRRSSPVGHRSARQSLPRSRTR